MRSTRNRKLKRKVPFIIICCLLILALLAGGYVLVKNRLITLPGVDTPVKVLEGQRLNVLLLGIDARKGETMARTDSIILASVDPKSKQVSLLSIPRDTRVNIPGYGWDKINSASVYGGPELSVKVVSSLLGIQLKYYVLTNFNGFKDIVDTLGGITLDVEQNMYHEDETDGGIYEINLKKGVQRLNGDKAIQYMRYRDYEMGDIDRTKHQQKFLTALGREMLQPSTIPKLPKLVTEINRYVKTNLSVSDMVALASAARSLENGNIVAQTLPGRPLEIGDGSYWGVDPIEAKQMVARLFEGQTTTSVVLTTPLSGQYSGPESLKTAVQPKTTNQTTATPAQQGKTPTGTQAKQGQSQVKQPAKPGQGTQGGATTVTSPSVVITQGGTAQGSASGKPATGTQTQTPASPGTGAPSGSGTVTPDNAGLSTGGASGTSATNPNEKAFNPAIPGVAKAGG